MDKKKESIILSVILLCLILIAVGMSYAFLKTSFFGAKTSVLKVGSLSLVLDETSGNAITVEDGTPMYDSEGVKQDNYFTFALKNNGVIDSAYTIYLEDQPLDNGDIRVGQSYVHYNLEKDSSVLPAKALEGDQAIDKGIIKKNQTINYKMRLWFSNDIPQSEENKVFKAKLNIVGSQNTRMMASNNNSVGRLWNNKQRTVTKIVFQDSIKSIDGESESWDISSAKNKTVMARLVPNTDDTTTNTLYIQGNGGVIANYNCYALFCSFSKLTGIENLNLLDTSNVTNMTWMFDGCISLISLDLSSFDTSNVTKMYYMFRDCNLANLDLSNFDTSQVTDMSHMFEECYKLTRLDVSNFDTSQVTDMSYMFSDCRSLTSLDLSNFDTLKVTGMSCMFSDCRSLTSLDLSNFDTSNVTYMGSMFSNCSSLASLDLSNFDTLKVTVMDEMFYSCNNLTSLNVSKFDTSNVTSMKSMFLACSSLTNLNVSNFNTSNVTNMSYMFSDCSSLTSLDLSNFDTLKVTNMNDMFNYCSKLTSLDFRKATFDKVTSYSSMFNSTPYTINIITKDETTKSWLEDKLGGKGTVTIA